eukprot:2796452-Amphidinium_carterae.2
MEQCRLRLFSLPWWFWVCSSSAPACVTGLVLEENGMRDCAEENGIWCGKVAALGRLLSILIALIAA